MNLFVLLSIVIPYLILIGIGVAIGLVCAACAGVFVALGIVSSSALIAILRHRCSAGLRMLHYQISAVIALPCGIGALWFGSTLCGFHPGSRYILTVGAVVGVAAGCCLAFIVDWLARFAYRRFVETPALSLPS